MNKRAYEHTKYFVEECGVRVAGTPQVIKASDYILDYYKTNGIACETHEFKVPVCQYGKSTVKITTEKGCYELYNTPVMFSKSTSVGGMELPIVYVHNGCDAALRGKDLKGKAVLIVRDVYLEYPDVAMYQKLAKYGVAAAIFTSSDGHSEAPFVYANFEAKDEDFTIPSAVIHYNDALDMVREGLVSLFYEVQLDDEMGDTRNTIGTVAGTDLADEEVIVCAHLDSTPSSPGATDDVAGVAVVMELARYVNEMAKAGKGPRRTMRFIAWSGHECGLHGSKYYLLDHMDLYDRTKFVLNYDVVGLTLGLYSIWATGNAEIEAKIKNTIDELGYEWPIHMEPTVVDTFNFAAKEVPTASVMSDFLGWNHTSNDNMRYISVEGFDYPIEFSKRIIEWCGWADDIEGGYPEEQTAIGKEIAEMYGWGLYGSI